MAFAVSVPTLICPCADRRLAALIHVRLAFLCADQKATENRSPSFLGQVCFPLLPTEPVIKVWVLPSLLAAL